MLVLQRLTDPKTRIDLRQQTLYKPFRPFVNTAFACTYDDENTERPTIYLNSYGKWSWETLDEETLIRILFHELTHLVGAEDDNSEGLLGNAETIDLLINGSFTKFPVWRFQILLGTPLNPISGLK
jgi:hypothetical protein